MTKRSDEYVTCAVCKRRKKPVGRSAPMETSGMYCDHWCDGYYAEPKPSQYWPGERDEMEAEG